MYSSNRIIFYNIYTMNDAYILDNKRQNKYQPLGKKKHLKL